MTQVIDRVDAHDALDGIITERDHLKTQLEQQKRTLDSQRQELAEQKQLLKELAVFKPLLNDPQVSYRVWLRDKALITVLKGKVMQWYGTGVDTMSEDKEVSRSARNTIELVIEECVRYGILTVPHIIRGLLDMKE